MQQPLFRITNIMVTILLILSLTACQKAKEPEARKETPAQKIETKPQPIETRLENEQRQEVVAPIQPSGSTEKKEEAKIPASKEKEIEGLYGKRVTLKGEIEQIRKFMKEGPDMTDKDEKHREAVYAMSICDRFTNLSRFEDPAATDITAEVIKTSQYGKIRACAAEAMGWYGNNKAVPVLLDAIKDKDDDVKLQAAGALLQLNEEVDSALETVDKLAQAEDASDEIAKLFKWEKETETNRYVRTWETLWNAKAEAIMRRALNYASDEIKSGAAFYFARKGEKELAENLAIEILKHNKWKDSPNSSYRMSDFRTGENAVHILEYLHSKKALPILKEVMNNPNASFVRNTAIRAIETIEKGR